MSAANTDGRVTKHYRMLLLAMLVSLGGLSWSNIAKASCSPYAGGATFNEAGTITTVYQISSTATVGSFGNVSCVTRTVRAMVN